MKVSCQRVAQSSGLKAFRPLFRSCSLIFLCLLLATHANTQAKPARAPIVITHVTIINPRRIFLIPNATVVIEGPRKSPQYPAARSPAVTPAKNARIIDGSGHFLIPGLWDMHVHTAFGDSFPGGRDIILPLFIANGVTGVRDMGGDVPVLSAWHKGIAAGETRRPTHDVFRPDARRFRCPTASCGFRVQSRSPLQRARAQRCRLFESSKASTSSRCSR